MTTINKILTYDRAIRIFHHNYILVITNGCFDILHAGHVSFLEECKSLGDILIVGVNTDSAVKKLKGNSRPINQLEYRMRVLAGLSAIDYVCPIDDVDMVSFIRDIKADFWVKGGYTLTTLNQNEVKIANLVNTKIILKPIQYQTSTTNIVSQICGSKT